MPSIPSQKDLFLAALRAHQRIYVSTRGVLGHRLLMGMPTLLLRTTGRRSGRTHTTSSVYGKDADRYLVCASNGGHRRDPDWCLNLEANPEVEIQVGVRRMPATAQALRSDHPDYARLFAICNRANRGNYAAYQRRTTRSLPVVVLTPR